MIIQLMIVLFMILIAFHATMFVKIGAMQRSSSLLIPMSYVFVGTLIVAIFIGIYYLIDLFHSLKEFQGGQK